MTDSLTDDQIAELERLYAASTKGVWQSAYYCKPDGTDIKTLDDVIKSITYAVNNSPLTALFGVTVSEGQDIGFTGNGLTSQANADAIAALHQAFPFLLRRLREAERERDEAEQEVEELKTNADEYEKDCTKALFAIANECEYEWDGDGATADDLREYISTTLEECTKNEQPLLDQIRVIERERAHLAGEVVQLREKLEQGRNDMATMLTAMEARDARQRKLGAAEELRKLSADMGTGPAGTLLGLECSQRADRLDKESEGE